jgi:tRNA (guanine-N7-)-methyltransferase
MAESHHDEGPAVGTAEYRATIASRQQQLREALARILPLRAEFVWELGSGHGHFLTAYAAAHPEKLCIGVDIVGERVERAIRKRDRGQLPNLHFLRAEARLFLETLPPGAALAEVFILFPDPWPKMRHQKHRIIQPAFLQAIAERATPQTRLFFRTDYTPYFEEALATINAHPAWQRLEEAWPFEFETVFQSRAPKFHSLIARRVPRA